MNQMTATQAMEKQGWVQRLATAVCQKLFVGICAYEMGLTPCETRTFMNYTGFGGEVAIMSQALIHLKWDEEVQP
ncbi:MAG: hypothetical protein HC804_14210 [Anaerolineae bacterium]|nr:hypothetical protein [Anaerolineae bacterium]